LPEAPNSKTNKLKMKIIAIVFLAFVAAVNCSPVQVSGNNMGDIVTVGVNANMELHNEIDQEIVNVIVALLNQQAIGVINGGGSDSAPEEVSPFSLDKISPQTLESLKKLIH